MASSFLAIQGPMKTHRNSSGCISRTAIAVAIIGETMGMSRGTRSGWYFRTNSTTAGQEEEIHIPSRCFSENSR